MVALRSVVVRVSDSSSVWPRPWSRIDTTVLTVGTTRCGTSRRNRGRSPVADEPGVRGPGTRTDSSYFSLLNRSARVLTKKMRVRKVSGGTEEQQPCRPVPHDGGSYFGECD